MLPTRFFAQAILLALTFAAGTLEAKTIYVNAASTTAATPFGTWNTAASNLQDALAIADSGDEVWVAQGTYYPDEGGGRTPDDRSAYFPMRNGAGIYGGFAGVEDALESADPTANPTILSGEIQQDDEPSNNAYHVILATSGAASATLQGFTIQGGNANASGEGFDSRGGGLYCSRVSPTIVDCLFLNNSAATHGGAIYNRASSPILTRCSFRENQAKYGGAVSNVEFTPEESSDPQEFSTPKFTNCEFLSNTGDEGGAIYNTTQSSPEIENCEFSGNQANIAGGAIYNFDASAPVITNCVFLGNRAKFPGGGAITNSSSSPILLNCSFQGNRDNNEGGAIRNSDVSSPSLTNCVVWNNRSDNSTNTKSASIFNESGSVPIFSHCLVENYSKSDLDSFGTSPDTNLAPSDPLFIEPADLATEPTIDGNLGLKFGSPAVDNGSNPTPVTTTDIVGNPRIANTTIDLGAIEGAHVEALSWTASPPLEIGASELRVTLSFGSSGLPEAWKSGLTLSTTGTVTAGTPIILGPNPNFSIIVNGLSGEGGLKLMLDSAETSAQGLFFFGETSFETVLRETAVSPRHFVDAGSTSSEPPYDSWETAAATLQDALAYAAPGDDVWVANGTYYPDRGNQQTRGDRSASFQLKSGIGIYGGFAGGEEDLTAADPTGNQTILSGDINEDSSDVGNSYRVLTAISTNTTAILQGFIIQDGTAYGVGEEAQGGGLYCSNASPTIAHCTFRWNRAASGGAIFYSSGTSPTLSNCSFLENYAISLGGAIHSSTSVLTLENCSFTGNEEQINGGGAIHSQASSLTVTNCSFNGNETGGDGGAIQSISSSGGFTNCIFQGNYASGSGGAMANNASSPALTNCSFQGNQSGVFGGALVNTQNAIPILRNCIIWDNDSGDLETGDESAKNASVFLVGGGPSVPIYSHCLVAGYSKSELDAGSSGNNNLDPVDPRFLEYSFSGGAPSSGGDLRLHYDSPVLDVGDNTANGSTVDLAGQARIINSTIDLGAYEGPVFGVASWEAGEIEVGSTTVTLALTLESGALPNGWESALLISTTGTATTNPEPASVQKIGQLYLVTLDGLAGDGRLSIGFDEAEAAVRGFVLKTTPTIELVLRSSSGSSTIFVNAANPNSMPPYSSWGTAANKLQDALAHALPGDSVWVATGTYYPDEGMDQTNGDSTERFNLKNGIAIHGGFAVGETEAEAANPAGNPTILSGDIDQDAEFTFNSFHVLLADETDATAMLTGFTITGGNADDPDSDNGGGGLYCKDNATPTIANCLFQENRAIYGGAIGSNRSSSPIVENCSFKGNEATEYGGAIFNVTSSAPVFTNCTFQGNQAALGGGAIANVMATSTFINCSMQGNRAGVAGGALYNFDMASTTLTNCIVWNNEADGSTKEGRSSVFYDTSPHPTFSFCLVENFDKEDLDTSGESPDTNFAPTDPLFVLHADPNQAPTTVGNLRLRIGSPMLDIGSNGENISLFDLGGNPRIQNGTIDLGAYEGGIDPEKPVIVLKGALSIDLLFGSQWTEPGAIVTDNADSDLSVSIGGAIVDPTKPGSYIVIYRATDSDGNSAIELTRTVTVGDFPVIDLTLGSGGRIETLTWTQGWILQTSDKLGPWTDVPGATSPFTVPPSSDPKRFWRLRSPE